MWFGIVSLFPEMFAAVSDFGVTGRAVGSGLLELEFWNPRDYTHDRHRTVDDRPYGGGPGMVMRVEPLRSAIGAARAARPAARVVYLSPQGRMLDQGGAAEFAEGGEAILVAGRYEGIDERVILDDVDEEWSIGDYVLTGGELGAMVLIDAVTRLLPGALGHADSAEEDSFTSGMLDYPHYTRPVEIGGRAVPEVLLSGDHARIREWRMKQALGRTWERRPDLLEGFPLDSGQRRLLAEYIRDREAGKES